VLELRAATLAWLPMCMMVYLAADAPLRSVGWDESAPAFNTSAIAPDEERVRRQFSKPCVLYAGSHEGCGCGFQLGAHPEHTEPAEAGLRRGSLHALAAYLRGELTRVGTIEVFACWDGDQEASPEHHRSLSPLDFETETFFFLQKELSTVSPDAG
jgi:hypothetical protein